MGGRPRAERFLERAVAAALLVVAAVPFWVGRYLPLLDLPQHLGLAAVIARAGDPAAGFARYYTVDPSVTPYWGYYGAMWLLTRAVPLELANRLLFTAYAVGLPLAAGLLLEAFGRDRRWAVFTVPLVFNTNLFFGFATYVVALPAFLAALALTERHLAAPRLGGRALALAVLATLVFLCHVQAYLVLGACVLALLVVHAGGARWWAGAVAPYLPSLGLFAAWFGRSFLAPQRAELGAHTREYRTYGGLLHLGAGYEPWQVVLRTMPERVLGSFSDGSDARLGLVLLVLFVAALMTCAGAAPDPAGAPPLRGWRAALRRHRCELLLAVLLASYLLVPMQISGAWYTNARHLVLFALALPLALARPARGWRAALAAAGAAVALAACVDAARQVRAFQRQVGDFDRVAAALPAGGRVLGLPFDLGSHGPVRTWPFLHWACWQQILAGGDVGFSFAGLPSIPVRYRPGMQAPHPYEWRPDRFEWAAMGRFYDAFLVSGEPSGRGGAELRAHAEVVARGGPFTLWRARDGLTDRPPSSR